jgi:hypothetical protein
VMADRPAAAVAATDRKVSRAPGRRALRELPWLAAGLGSLIARQAHGQSYVDTRFLFYKESGGRTEVLNPVVFWNQDLGQSTQLSMTLGYDAISGASPTGGFPTADTTTSASGTVTTSGNFPQSQYTDSRKSAGLSLSRKFGANLPSIDVSYAKENDYTARSIGFSDAWTMLEGRGTLHFGASFSRDIVAPVANAVSNPTGADLRLPKSTNGFSLGWTWILGERDLVDVSASVLQLSGYLNDPYKIVPIGPDGSSTTLPDIRPDTRSRRSIVGKYSHYFLWGGSIQVLYRYYFDDWSVRANTLDVSYNHRFGSDWIVSPTIRLYTQTGANFYGNRFLAPERYMSSDYRLAPLDSALGGLTVTHRIDASIGVNLGGTIQSQRGRDRILLVSPAPDKERGSTSVSAADLTVLTFTAGLTWSF